MRVQGGFRGSREKDVHNKKAQSKLNPFRRSRKVGRSGGGPGVQGV